MNLTPGKRLDSSIDDIGTVLTNLQDAGHRKAGAAVTVVLDDDLRVLVLDHLHQLTQHGRLTDTGHILQTDLWSTGLYQLLSDIGIVLGSMDGAVGDTQGSLWCHTSLQGIFDRRNDITDIVQTAEDTGDVYALSMLNLIHQTTYVGRYGEHTQCVKTAVQHVGLDAHFIKRLGEGTNCLIGVLAVKQIHLLKGSTVCFYTGETTHLDDNGCDAL